MRGRRWGLRQWAFQLLIVAVGIAVVVPPLMWAAASR